jgi:hypothetical protein
MVLLMSPLRVLTSVVPGVPAGGIFLVTVGKTARLTASLTTSGGVPAGCVSEDVPPASLVCPKRKDGTARAKSAIIVTTPTYL